MKHFTSVNHPEIITILKAGGIGIVRTDTLYGIIAIASDHAAVEKVYTVKGRDDTKSPITLINSVEQLYDQPDETISEYLSNVWPGPVSVIIPSTSAPEWIRRQNASVAYRLPDHAELRGLIRSVGPLIAPSANPQGEEPAETVERAIEYFGDNVDFYVDGGQVHTAKPSQLIRIHDDGTRTKLR